MKISAIVAGLVAIASAAPSLESRHEKTCIATFRATNSEGGGGPGQAPEDSYACTVEVDGRHKKYYHHFGGDGENGSCDVHILAKKWGGEVPIRAEAQYNYGGLVWYKCLIHKYGKDYHGKVLKQKVDPDIVTVTTDNCVVHFPCL